MCFIYLLLFLFSRGWREGRVILNFGNTPLFYCSGKFERKGKNNCINLSGLCFWPAVIRWKQFCQPSINWIFPDVSRNPDVLEELAWRWYELFCIMLCKLFFVLILVFIIRLNMIFDILLCLWQHKQKFK